jgi:hypothetical protein
VRWLSTSLFEGEVWKQEIEHLGFKAQYSNIYGPRWSLTCGPKIPLQNKFVS